ncbi:hypothetical protein KR067_000756, partial [Drosophila pandora]
LFLFQFFVASAVLIALCGADVSHLKAEKIDLPFNDLLPPLLEESTTSTTTTTAKPITTTVATKPTKKSYYQKPAQEKPKATVAKEDIQKLSLDLLPPFEDEKPAEEKTQKAVKSEPSPVVKPTQKPVVPVPAKPFVPVAAKPVVHITPKPVVHTTSRPLVHATPRPVAQVAPQQPQYSVHPAPQVALPVQNSASRSGFQSRFSNYFLTSTVRPRRGPLPTITPFPHFVRL